MIQDSFGPFPLGFQGGGAFPQDIVQFDDAIFDRAVKPLESVFGVGQLLLQGDQSVLTSEAPEQA